MRFISVSVLSVSFISSLVSGALGSGNLLGRTDATTDLCGEIDVVFKVPNFLLPGKFITLGNIRELSLFYDPAQKLILLC